MPNPFIRVESLLAVTLYQAPADAKVNPTTIPPHTEIIELLVGGAVDFEVDGRWMHFERGGLFCHQSGQQTIWRTTVDAPYRCIVFRFNVSDGRRLLPRASFFHEMRKLDTFATECLELFHAPECDRNALGCYIYGTLLKQNLLTGSRPATEHGKYPIALCRITEYIRNNLNCELEMKELCTAGGVSRAQIFRLFREYLDVTPHGYISARRIALARRLLAGSVNSIKEVAGMCGFANIEVFYRNFRNTVGQTPADYRRNCSAYNFDHNDIS